MSVSPYLITRYNTFINKGNKNTFEENKFHPSIYSRPNLHTLHLPIVSIDSYIHTHTVMSSVNSFAIPFLPQHRSLRTMTQTDLTWPDCDSRRAQCKEGIFTHWKEKTSSSQYHTTTSHTIMDLGWTGKWRGQDKQLQLHKHINSYIHTYIHTYIPFRGGRPFSALSFSYRYYVLKHCVNDMYVCIYVCMCEY
jgi:hypothetical protein